MILFAVPDQATRTGARAGAIFLLAGLFCVACTSMKRPAAPCFDGWTTEASGSSRLLKDGDRLTALVGFIPPNEHLECVHELPTGKLILITRAGATLKTLSLEPAGGSYLIVDRGFIVSADR